MILSALFECQSHEGDNVRTDNSGTLPASVSDIDAPPEALRGGKAAEERFRQCALSLTREDVSDNTKNILFYGNYIVTSLYDRRNKRSTIVAASPDGADIIKLATLSEYRHLSAIDPQTLYAGTFDAAKDQPYYINLMTGKLEAAEFPKITHSENSYVNLYVCDGFTFYCVGDEYSDEEIYEPVRSYYVKPDGREKYIKLDANGDWSAYEDTIYTVDFFMDDKEEFMWQFYSYRGGKQTEQIKLRNALNMDMRLIGKWGGKHG